MSNYEGAAIAQLTAELYFDEFPDVAELEKLKSINLLGILQKEVGEDAFDIGKVKVVFRALKIAKPFAAIEYLKNNLSELVVFAKEVTLLMQTLEVDHKGCFDEMENSVVEAILSPPAFSVQLIRTWLLELFVRGVINISAQSIKDLSKLSSPMDRRQLHLIRGRFGDKNHFRKNKTTFGQFSSVEQTSFVAGASCLPIDEYKSWIPTIRKMINMPLADLFLKWCLDNKDTVIKKMTSAIYDHGE